MDFLLEQGLEYSFFKIFHSEHIHRVGFSNKYVACLVEYSTLQGEIKLLRRFMHVTIMTQRLIIYY